MDQELAVIPLKLALFGHHEIAIDALRWARRHFDVRLYCGPWALDEGWEDPRDYCGYNPDCPGFKTADCYAWCQKFKPDVVLSVWWREKIPKEVYEGAPLGGYNWHPSELPLYAGQNPINYQIAEGETCACWTIHELTPSFDAGRVAASDWDTLPRRPTALDYYRRVQAALPSALEWLWVAHWSRGRVAYRDQREVRPSFLRPARRTNEMVAVAGECVAGELDALVRAVCRPWPGQRVGVGGGRVVRVWEGRPGTRRAAEGALEIECGDGVYTAVDWEEESLPW